MKRQLSLLFLVLFLLLTPVTSHAQASAGIISPTRATDWSTAGISGGLPDASWTQYGSTIAAEGASGSPVSPATIISALSACSAVGEKYVLLGPGNFYLNGQISFGNSGAPASNCVLRGSGANATFLHFPQSASNGCGGEGGNICLTGTYIYPGGGYIPANWTGGLSQGSSSIQLTFLTWHASTAYTSAFLGSTVIQDPAGHIQAVYVAGTSGATIPTFNDSGSQTTDGTMQWTDMGTAASVLPQVNLTPIVLDQCNTGFTDTSTLGGPTCTGTPADNGSIYVCDVAGTCAVGGPSNTQRTDRDQEEVVVATAVSGSNPYTLTLDHAIVNPNWASGLAPQAWWGKNTITNAGVEDLYVDDSSSNSPSIAIVTANKCWVARVASYDANSFHIYAYITAHTVERDNYIFATENAETTSYGYGGIINGEMLIENNISQQVTTPIDFDASCSTCAVGYNFAVDNYNLATDYQFGEVDFHAAGEGFILTEGNVGSYADPDDVHGGHQMLTFFRNFWNGYESQDAILPTRNVQPVSLSAYSRYMNLVGNVDGTAGIFTTYECVPAASNTAICPTINRAVIEADWAGNTHGQADVSSPPSPNDLLVLPTAMFWGNYDVLTGTRFCGNSSDTGWSTNCGSASEIPTGISLYPNSVPTLGDTGAGQGPLPASFYTGVTAAHPSCGTGLSFWKNPTTGTCPVYPPIGPDVTGGTILMCTSGTYQWSRVLSSTQCAGGTSAADSGHDNPIPAMICYLNQMSGPPNGTGSMLTFNPEACYTKDPAVAGSQPIAPTGIVATVQQ
jgi:hypothetical protein